MDKRDLLETVTRRLLEKEVMEGDELRAILDGSSVTDQSASDERDRNRAPRDAVDRVVIPAGDGRHARSAPRRTSSTHPVELDGMHRQRRRHRARHVPARERVGLHAGAVEDRDVQPAQPRPRARRSRRALRARAAGAIAATAART